ncbi:MAG: N-acetylneuraminate synthase [Ignavibacteria bacterium]|nr:N-acetylneuraminate synthase [Ignavibacteria bacterium]
MKKTFIIAEAGVNHNGNIDLAYKLIDEAVKAGADAVKFQTAVPELVMTEYATKAEYQIANTGESGSQIEMAKKIHLPLEAYKELKEYCEKNNIMFLSTPFDMKSLELLLSFEMKYMKIPSGEITNYPYLKKIGEQNMNVIISTGMSTIKDVEECLNLIVSSGTEKEKITLLHCTTEYPAPLEEVNLKAMLTLKNTFGVNVGYSDHTKGIEISIAAAAMGAAVIEKHFTLDNKMEGPDHVASLEPHELKEMVRCIRNVDLAMGDGDKQIAASEEKNIVIARKSILAAHDIEEGEEFTDENLIVKRPGSGINPMRWNEVIGKKAKRKFSKDEFIEL